MFGKTFTDASIRQDGDGTYYVNVYFQKDGLTRRSTVADHLTERQAADLVAKIEDLFPRLQFD